jgi:hypothetical protein
MKKIIIFLSLMFLVVACTPKEEPNIQATVDASVLETQSALDEIEEETLPTNTPENSRTPEPTKAFISTSISTPTSTEEPTQDVVSQVKAKNFVATVEQNGVIVEVERILICDDNWDDISSDFSDVSLFDDKTTYVEFIFRITNNTEEVIGFNFYTSIASANGEQISIEDYIWAGMGWMGDDLDKDILPGSTVIGGVWTGVKRSTWDEIDKIIISIPGANDKDYSSTTDDYLIEIEVGDWGFEPFPEDG